MKIGTTKKVTKAPRRKAVKVTTTPVGIPVTLPKKKEADVPTK